MEAGQQGKINSQFEFHMSLIFCEMWLLIKYFENIYVVSYSWNHYSLASMYGMGEMVQHVEEASEKSIVMLDDYNSDLHLVLDDDGYVI